jgi:Domain of unknown function (DUF4286)
MFFYNITVNVEQDVAEDWLQWIKTVYVPQIMRTGYFKEQKVLRLLNEIEGNTGVTYALQFECLSMGALSAYLDRVAPLLQKEHYERYAGKHVSFQTILQEV